MYFGESDNFVYTDLGDSRELCAQRTAVLENMIAVLENMIVAPEITIVVPENLSRKNQRSHCA